MADPFPGLRPPAGDCQFAHGRHHLWSNDYAIRQWPCQRTGVGKLAGQRRDRPTVSTYAALVPAVVRSPVGDFHWLSSDHCAGPVFDLLGALGWAIVDTPEANVHATLARTVASTSAGSPRMPPLGGGTSSGTFGCNPPKVTRGSRSSVSTPPPRPSPGFSPHWSPNPRADRRTSFLPAAPPAPTSSGQTSPVLTHHFRRLPCPGTSPSAT